MRGSLISIIIPTFNRSHLLGETLDSIICQTYQSWECILIDDGSTDATLELMEFYSNQDSRIKFHPRPHDRPKGANSCRNYGFELSKGDYINWFDSDDLMKETFLERKIAGFNNGVDMVISKSELISHNEEFIRKENRTKETDNLFEDFICLKVSWYLPDPMYKRKFLTGKELFNEDLFKGQDREFHIRRLLEDPQIKFIDEYLTMYRQSELSISNDFSPNVIRSNYVAINKQLEIVISNGGSRRIKLFYLREQIKKYPYLYNIKGVTIQNYLLFYKLYIPNLELVKWFVKYNLAVISFQLLGKGTVFLKS